MADIDFSSPADESNRKTQNKGGISTSSTNIRDHSGRDYTASDSVRSSLLREDYDLGTFGEIPTRLEWIYHTTRHVVPTIDRQKL